MKKLFSLLVCLTLILGLGVLAYAEGEGRFGREGTAVGYVDVASSAADIALKAAPCYVYAATLFPSAANGYVYLYDNASAASGTVKIELSEATAYDSKREIFDPPIKMDNGVYADVNNAAVTIEYR